MSFTTQGGFIIGLQQTTEGAVLPESDDSAMVTQAGLIVGSEPTVFAAGDVNSVFGRKGDVISQEGDYSITQMGDVDTTTTPPDPKDFLIWGGAEWTPGNRLDSGTFT